MLWMNWKNLCQLEKIKMEFEEHFEEQSAATINLQQKHIDAIGIDFDYFEDEPRINDKLFYFIEAKIDDDEETQNSHTLHPIFERNLSKLTKTHQYVESHGAVPIFYKENKNEQAV